MSESSPESSETLLQSSIEKIESAYEYMLAYAAQGRKDEPSAGAGKDGLSIRGFLEALVWGIKNITEGFDESAQAVDLNSSAKEKVENFKAILTRDANSALAVVEMVLSVPSLSSQVIDNLNASTHVRSLLTDIFVIDEVLKIHQRNQTG
ncbi:hypothetical protein JYT97_01665 [Haliea sp. AH-315-K21]|nr:hypothetical protein [Haliea sp. AH-315-K21]